MTAAAVHVLALAGCATTAAKTAPTESLEQTATVTAVVDGDTFKISTSSGDARIRIIGIDTPEIGRDGKTSECYAEQARTMLDQLVYGRTVTLSPDPTQADTDKYGRLLRHVYLNGVSVALTELQAGAGREYAYDKPYNGQADYRAAEKEAENAKRGLWEACAI